MNDNLLLATDAAVRAGDAIEVIRERGFSTSAKGDASPVTEADLAADAIIRETLASSMFPVLSEETWREGEGVPAETVWVVDPLDGTKDFVAGRQHYVVQIALVTAGRPVLGVVWQPSQRRGWRGLTGAHRRLERFQNGWVRFTPPTSAVTARPRLAVSVSHPSALVDAVVQQTDALTLPMGSVGLKIGAIVDGEADAYVSGSSAIKVWDTAAPEAILAAAGGGFSDLEGAPLRYDGDVRHRDGVFGALPSWREALLPAIQNAPRG